MLCDIIRKNKCSGVHLFFPKRLNIFTLASLNQVLIIGGDICFIIVHHIERRALLF